MLFADSVERLHVSDQTTGAKKQLQHTMAAEALNLEKLLAVMCKI